MKNYSLGILFILVAGFVAQLFLPWWIIAAVAALAAIVFKLPSAGAFAIGFAAAALLWSGYAGFLNHANAGALSGMVGKIFQNVEGNTLVYLTGLIGGLLGGLGAMTGSFGRALFAPKAPTS